MARKQLIRSNELPYHVTTRSNNQQWFYIPQQLCWNIFADKLDRVSVRYNAEIIAFVLMSNHMHLILRTPDANLDKIMQYLVRESSKAIARTAGRINRIFGGRYKWSVIHNRSDFAKAYKYLYRNPVDANMVRSVEEYPFSTMQELLQHRKHTFPIYDLDFFPTEGVPVNLKERLLWLNTPFENQKRDLIKKALRRSVFETPDRLR